MKQLLLVRHAKSSWSEAPRRDFDRPLNARGERNAPEMAARLAARGIRAQLIVASGARRALATAQKMAGVLGYPVADIEIVDALYEASEDTWYELIRALPPSLDTVLMVGHNPEISAVANRLCPRAHIVNMPTCGVLWLEYALADWRELPQSVPRRWDFDYPKRLPEVE